MSGDERVEDLVSLKDNLRKVLALADFLCIIILELRRNTDLSGRE